ncbi:hypothetical protein [Leptobacterium sp. I13]|uniref:hypothetical protein n=1 Tax=Leptobacterium meishanense TaxID=3128904 RepID=UPI0030EB32A7
MSTEKQLQTYEALNEQLSKENPEITTVPIEELYESAFKEGLILADDDALNLIVSTTERPVFSSAMCANLKAEHQRWHNLEMMYFHQGDYKAANACAAKRRQCYALYMKNCKP